MPKFARIKLNPAGEVCKIQTAGRIHSPNNQNPENVASNMYKIFQRAANEKNPMENNQEPTNINNNPSENTAHQG